MMEGKVRNMSNENVRGALAYLLGPITGIAFLVLEKKNAFIRFHAMQSTIVFGSISLIYAALPIIPILGPVVELLLSPIFYLGSSVLWFFLMWKAYTGEKYHVPYLGDLAERSLKKI